MLEEGEARQVVDPADHDRIIGSVVEATPEMAETALDRAHRAFPGWDATPADSRATILEKAADLYEAHLAELCAVCVREAGKTMADAVAEVREAGDVLRYSAHRARPHFAEPEARPGPTRRRHE